MTVKNWYDEKEHVEYPKIEEMKTTNPLDLLEAVEQRRRELMVKQAHMKYIEDRLRRCYMFEGVANFPHKCRKYIEEFKQTKDEFLGFKKDKRVSFQVVNLLVG
jgi:hypothetical protein